MEKQAGWILSPSHVLFLNGIINFYKPKKCLEIGVAEGGSSVLILNSLEKINDSILVSIDLNINLYYDQTKKTGYRVNKYFPELSKNWKLFTGDQPHKFLDKLNMKFDFVFLDTSHHSPGELINIIEIMPFLNENAIVVLHDINLQLISQNITLNYRPTQIYLMSSLFGDKIYVKNKDNAIENIGAVILHKNQQKHYLDYFLLLTTLWEYMPSESQINDLRLFIKKYYKEDIYFDLFNLSVEKSKNFLNKYNKLIKSYNISLN
jgi:predicted O-methyltransferase YrrM